MSEAKGPDPANAERSAFESARAARLRRLSCGLAGVALAIGLATLVLGWALRIDWVLRQAEALPVMVPSTALAVVLLSLSLVIPADRPGVGLLRRGCAVATLLLCGWAGVDANLPDPVARMSATTAALLALAAVVSLIPRTSRARTTLSTAGLLLAVFALASWIFDLSATQSLPVFTGLSLPTALCLTLIFAALLLRTPERGWIALTILDGIGSRTARTVLPLTVLLPLLGAGLAVLAVRQGMIPPTLALTAGATFLALLSTALVLRLARLQNHEEAMALQHGQRFAQLLDAVPAAVFVFGGDGRLEASNRAAQDLPPDGQSAEAWLHEARFLDPEGRKPLAPSAHPFEAFVKARREGSMLVGLMDAASRMRVLLVRAQRLNAPAQAEASLILTLTDQSDSFLLQDRLAGARRREALGELAGGMAHELSNVLGVIRLASDTGLLRDDPAAQRQALESVREACTRGGDLTRRLLAFGTDGGARDHPGDAGRLLANALRLVRPSIPERFRLETTLPDAPIGSIGRGTNLQTALLNLVLNARNALAEAGRSEGQIAVAAHREADRLILSVQDDGPGMSAEVLGRASEPFFTTRQDRGGSGLGLSLTAAFAREMGGSLTLTSQPGQGTTAVLTLPIGPDIPDTAEADAPLGGRDVLTGRRVLVVEDDHQFRAMMGEALRHLGLEVTTAESAETAMAVLDAETGVDLLITDIRLGGQVDGHRLAELAVTRRPGLVVLYMSGHAENHVPPERVVPGMVLRKPSSIAALRRAVSLSLHA